MGVSRKVSMEFLLKLHDAGARWPSQQVALMSALKEAGIGPVALIGENLPSDSPTQIARMGS